LAGWLAGAVRAGRPLAARSAGGLRDPLVPTALVAAALLLAALIEPLARYVAAETAARADWTAALTALEPQAGATPPSETAVPQPTKPSGLPAVLEDPPAALADIARELAERHADLAARERELAARARAIVEAETQLRQQLVALESLQAEIAAMLNKAQALDEAEAARLVKIYEAMNPKRAAAVFDRLEPAMVVGLVMRMRESRTAAILGAMDPARVRIVTAELARQRALGAVAGAARRDPPPVGPPPS
jgi:flagellar motility protein MotE (MotC chaperone)